MGKIAYKVASHQDSMVKDSLPDDYITEYIDADKLESLDGWETAETNDFFEMINQNEEKLAKFQEDQKTSTQITTSDPANEISDLNSLKTELANMKKRQAEIETLIQAQIDKTTQE